MRLIDADALYYKVKCECNPYGKPTIDFESGKKVLDWIEKAPTIEIPQWIPCSERLPKDCEIVLASFKTGVVQMCKYFDSGRDDSWWSYKDDCFAWDNTVVAWMPMPTPYKGEGDEK